MKSGLLHLYTKPTTDIEYLLINTTLGSNGALYQLLDTPTNVHSLDNPLFLTIERGDKTYANITFCRRNDHWYIRYFAFESVLQSAGKTKSKSSNGILTNEINSFLDETLEKGYQSETVNSFYAYIDPKNTKSVWMSEKFGFRKVGEKATQTFSRISPKKRGTLSKSADWSILSDEIKSQFNSNNYFFEKVFFEGEFYYSTDDNGKIIAFCKTSIAHWKIKRLPGKFGSVLTKIIPFIPGINRLIRPNNHTFVVPEAVWVKENDVHLLSSFFEGILENEKLNLMIWWIDIKDELFIQSSKAVRWGFVNRIVKRSNVNIVAKSNDLDFINKEKPFYSAGMDSF